MKLAGKVAIITGASSGIGAAAARLFASEGARVVVNYSKSEAKALEVVRAIRGSGGEAIAVRADVSKPNEVDSMIRFCIDHFSGIDILVNNAGRIVRIPDPLGLDDEVWGSMLDINLKGAFLCSKAAAPIMLERGGGSIINVSSINNVMGTGSNMAYGCAKAGQIVLTRWLARRLAPKIRVNCIALGIIETPMIADMPDAKKVERMRSILLGRFGRPEEVAKVMLFLASDDSSFITGQTIIVDGGQFLGPL
ncbi:MAG: SDR family NAD(P)-dependent oxidoreductase [Candidatus Bathyarchaeia archaeon]